MEYYVLSTDGHAYGPVNEAGLKDWVREGRIAPNTLIREGGGGTRRADDLPFLRSAFAVSASPWSVPRQTTQACPSCGGHVVATAAFCEHCGFKFNSHGSGRTITRTAWMDALLGFCLFGLLSYLAYFAGASGRSHIGAGIVAYLCGVVAYVALRESYPAFARGLGIGLLLIFMVAGLAVLLILGLLAICSGFKW